MKKIVSNISNPVRTFIFEVLMFTLAAVLSFLASNRMMDIFVFQRVEAKAVSIWDIIIPFFILTGFLVLIIYFIRHKKFRASFFKVFYILAIALGNLYFFGLWFSAWIVFPWIAVLIYLLIKKPNALIHNLVFIFAVSGMATVVGLQLAPREIILMLLFFSVYDFVAVYKTKHMVKMAEAMVESKAIVGLVIPQKTSDFKTNLNKIPIKGNFMILGGGDIIFPLILAVSVLNQGILQFLIIVGFAILGLLAVFLIFITKKQRAPMPALPPIALACIIGYVITKLI
ncbi:MAG: hypothetical protein HQ539_01535 [Parcubacteria group bacterium]|nr:hypothetical protein [Parcubacteria group bacterium]